MTNEKNPEVKNCTKSKDKKFITPCDSLREASEYGYNGKNKSRGIFFLQFTNLKTHEPSRSFFAVKSGEHNPKGLALNFCPFCGKRIDTF